MKLSYTGTLLGLISLATNGVKACWQVHTFLNSDPFAGDVLSLQAFNDNVELCNSGSTSYLASGETTWTITCGHLVFTMTNNGASGHVSDPDAGYEAALVASNTHQDTVDCYCNDDGCLNCLQVESCLDDNYWNCNNYPYCELCDYRSSC